MNPDSQSSGDRDRRPAFDQRGQTVGVQHNAGGDLIVHAGAPAVDPAVAKSRGITDPTAPAAGSVAASRVAPEFGRWYVVFTRLVDLAVLKTEEIAGSQHVLIDLAAEFARERGRAFWHQATVYGRIYFARGPLPAIELAEQVLQRASARGVRLAVGVAVGNLEPADDLGLDALNGPAISTAARIAFTDAAIDGVVIAPKVEAVLRTLAGASGYKIGKLQSEPVKGREWPLHVVGISPGNRGPTPRRGYDGPAEGQAVVFDIARFSTKDAEKQWDVVQELRRRVGTVLREFNLQPLRQQGGPWYAPAGDGGVLVFPVQGPGSTSAFPVAERLTLLCSEYSGVELRVSVATGTIVVVAGQLPVGGAVMRADALSAFPRQGEIAVDRAWLTATGMPAPAGWNEREKQPDEKAAKDAGAVILVRH